MLIALVLAVALTVGWGPLLAPWRELGLTELLGLLALSALSYGFRAVRVFDYFRPAFAGRFPTVLRLSILHNVANNLLPMRAGEMVFPWLMGRYFGQGFGNALASLIWIRLLDMHFLGLIACLILYLRQPWIGWPLAGLLWLLLLPLMARVGRLAPTGSTRMPARLASTLARAAPVSRRLIARLYLWTALSWTAKFIAFALLLQHFLPLDLWRLLIGVLAVEDAGADAHQAMLTDLAAVEHGLMAYGDAVMDDEGRPTGEETTIVGDMQDAAVLDIGFGTDANSMDVAARHNQGPDGGPLPDLHVAHHHGGLVDPDPGGEAGLLAQIGADVGHGLPGARNEVALAANANSNRWN